MILEKSFLDKLHPVSFKQKLHRRCFLMIFPFIHSLINFIQRRKNNVSANLHRQKKIDNNNNNNNNNNNSNKNKVNWLCMFNLYESQSSNVYLQTRYEHLWSFHSLMFCSRLTGELLFYLRR